METQVLEKKEKTVSMPVLKLASSYPQARVHGRVITTKVVGVSFENRQEIVAKLQMGDVFGWSGTLESCGWRCCQVLSFQWRTLRLSLPFTCGQSCSIFRAYRFPVKGKVSLLTGSAWDGYTLGVVISFKIPN